MGGFLRASDQNGPSEHSSRPDLSRSSLKLFRLYFKVIHDTAISLYKKEASWICFF
jgi:hypothetical protein